MKPALIAIAFAATLSIPAFAQDTTQTTTTGSMPAAGDASMQAPAADPTQPPAPSGAMTPPAGSDSTMPVPTTPGAMPPTDSGRTSTMPSGGGMSSGGMASGGMSSSGMASMPAAGDSANYPVCSKTVTDRCINRGSKRMKKG